MRGGSTRSATDSEPGRVETRQDERAENAPRSGPPKKAGRKHGNQVAVGGAHAMKQPESGRRRLFAHFA